MQIYKNNFNWEKISDKYQINRHKLHFFDISPPHQQRRSARLGRRGGVVEAELGRRGYSAVIDLT